MDLSGVRLGLEDGLGKYWDDSITTGFGGPFEFDDVLKIVVLDDEIGFSRKARLPSNLPARALEDVDELALVFLFGFAALGHIVMAMVIVLAMMVKAMIVVMAKTTLYMTAKKRLNAAQ